MHRRHCLAGIPILTFHSVRRRKLGELGDLSLEEEVFDAGLRALARGGYRTITAEQLVDHLQDGASLPPRPILLTFDDGYLDNWTIAAPRLAAYGLRATVFVATDSIRPGETPRPTSGECDDPPESGWLNEAELREMERRGVFEVQCHTASHARHPRGPEVVDYHRPGAPCAWLALARRPELRGREHEVDLTEALPLGTPVYRPGWMGEITAFRPDPALEKALCAHVAAGGGAAYFERADWRAGLDAIVREHGEAGDFEDQQARRARLAHDLVRARGRLEEILGREVDLLAWPGGGTSPLAQKVALGEAGFRATFGTDRVCAGVSAGPTAIPRAYFSQHRRGPFSRIARVMKLRGIADLESGRSAGRLRVAAANRLLNWFSTDTAAR